jgi:L-alanine-DL-glutamate epimerase-like enolase superfamily enzyme
MKITGLELIPVFSTREMGRSSPSDPNKSISYHVIVRLHTDAGVVGLGEMSDIDFASDAPTVERLQRKLEPLLLEKDPFARGSIAIDLESRTWDHQVVCGIDIAVHDAVAKALDVPLHVLFGGKLRDPSPSLTPWPAARPMPTWTRMSSASSGCRDWDTTWCATTSARTSTSTTGC